MFNLKKKKEKLQCRERKLTTESHLLPTAHPTVTKPTSLFKPTTNLLLLCFAAEHEQQTSHDGRITDEKWQSWCLLTS